MVLVIFNLIGNHLHESLCNLMDVAVLLQLLVQHEKCKNCLRVHDGGRTNVGSDRSIY